MSKAFLFLCCLALVCSLAWAIPTVWLAIVRHRERLHLLRRDNAVKTDLIRQLHLEIAMLRTAMNLQDTVMRARAKRSRPYLVSNTPNLLRPQA
jgi:hypothetical protein